MRAVARRPDAVVELLKAIACYEYQSCEGRDWEGSQAASRCDEARRQLVTKLPGYQNAPWGFEAGDLGSDNLRRLV